MKQQHFNFQQHSVHRKTPLKISHMNLYHCKSMTSGFLNGHTYPKVIFTMNGNGYININDDRFPLSKDDIYLINYDNFHCTVEPAATSVDFAIVGFEEISFLFSKDENDSFFAHYTLDNAEDHNLLKGIMEELEQEKLHYELACDHYMNLLFLSLQRKYGVTYHMINKEKSNHDCEKIRNYIDEHYAENITLDVLAKESNMNKYYLVHSFTNNYGCSPINYLNKKKIDESKLLLETTNYSIADIAKLIGFSSQSYFSQSFKKHTYMTPNEYRHSIRQL